MRPWGLLVVMLGACATQGTTSASEASATTSSSGASLGSSAPDQRRELELERR
jgi:hypothetical protein